MEQVDDLTSSDLLRYVQQFSWLKSLRLHKYAPQLLGDTLDNLCQMPEEAVRDLGLTAGASKKILSKIAADSPIPWSTPPPSPLAKTGAAFAAAAPPLVGATAPSAAAAAVAAAAKMTHFSPLRKSLSLSQSSLGSRVDLEGEEDAGDLDAGAQSSHV